MIQYLKIYDISFQNINYIQTQNLDLQTMDNQMKEFYISMGYNQQQVIRAYEYSLKNKIDVLDALNIQPKKAQQSRPPPSKKQNNFVNPQQNIPKDTKNSFLVASSKIKFSDYETIYSISNKQNILNSKYQLREAHSPVGLLNVSNCCYLNSLLQCYFLMTDFRVALFSAEPIANIAEILGDNKTKLKRIKNQFELLTTIKNFFTKMLLSSKKFLDPTQILQNLVDSVGQKISYGQQKDLSEINIMIIQRISEGLSFCRQYYEEQESKINLLDTTQQFSQLPKQKRYVSIYNPKTGQIKKLFYGTKVEYYDDELLKNEAPIVSDFTGIILNPRFGTLQNALQQEFNFSVQINGKTIKKQMFIRQEPQYMFMYINRTQYDRDMGQAQKNQQTFSFDFTFYLDRYLQKYKSQKNEKDVIITQLVQKRNKVKEQINSIQLLHKKMGQCYKYANQLDGWIDKLPSQEDFELEYTRLKEKSEQIQKELQKIESRQQKYHLMYIFVHRGDAVSGHYWGYGKNGQKWYKFDIKCRQIQEQQIVVDIQKTSATPYALLYVKEAQLPNFTYNHYLEKSVVKDSLGEINQYLNTNLVQEMIKENNLMHNDIKIRNNQIFKKKSYSDYINRFKAIKNFNAKHKQQISQIKQAKFIKMYFQDFLNFSTFLYSKAEYQLCKFTLFEQSILFASSNKIDSQKLLNDKHLLELIQKKFRKSCKGQIFLRNYALIGKDLERYRRFYQQYQLQLFQIVWCLYFTQEFERLTEQLSKINLTPYVFRDIEIKDQIKTYLLSVLKIITVRNQLKNLQQFKNAQKKIENQMYISKVNDEISKLAILKLVIYGFKFENMSFMINLSDASVKQIAVINAKNSIIVPKLGENISAIQSSKNWISNYFKKNVKRSSLNQQKNMADIKNSRKISNSQLSPVKSSNLLSPNSKKISIQQKKQQINFFQNQDLLILDVRQNWKIQDLQNARRFNIAERVKIFLQRMGIILQFYKVVVESEKAFSIQQIAERGIVLNQKKIQQQSLI